ncbi:hypothetical protein B0H67DRAFT_644110 [Lasiosphaeris hirsuta]|uniref:HNH nuclease domain-containing protein n=1 Tax=Lasiosphaeris hirsuta TaxID=260670 RepID=A0AA40ARY6_9PEZI|nr:hypothetical protein B0H67DRAFT_644110 [Lasiosphaeris hirsuta]
MSSSAAGPSGSGPPEIPKRTSSKRARTDLLKEYHHLGVEFEEAKKKVRPSTSFDARYWTSAAARGRTCYIMVGDDEARRIIEQIKAATMEKSLYTRQAERINQGGPIRRAFQAMFTARQLGVCADKVGMGPRKRSEQAKFKDDLIQFYGAATMRPNKPKAIKSVHDTATGLGLPKHQVTAAHLFPYKLGPDVLVSLFGEDVEGELMTARNGLLLQSVIESALDDGAIAIVPGLPDDPTTEQVAIWERDEPKNYRWRIIDEDAELLEAIIALKSQGASEDMTIRDLDGRRLSFKNDNRPRARYLYFLFVVAQLKMAWRHEYWADPAKKLKPQLGEGFWVTRGRYLNRALLLALAEEIGHNTSFPENMPPCPGTDDASKDEEDAGETGLVVIAKIIAAQKRGDEEEDEEE